MGLEARCNIPIPLPAIGSLGAITPRILSQNGGLAHNGRTHSEVAERTPQ